jgi:SAM-dependent methyltransferase
VTPRVSRAVRRTVFGRDPVAYDRARLAYPPQLYAILQGRCGLRRGAAVFEIGPGTGIATRQLLKLGAGPLTLIEADRRLVRFLKSSFGSRLRSIRVIPKPFERATLDEEAYDLGVAASSFHWLPRRQALRKVARALRSGGWWAAWNNHHGDPSRPGPFARELDALYQELGGGRRSFGPRRTPEALDAAERTRRLGDLASVGRFDRIARDELRWKVTLTTPRVQALWATFSDVLTLPARERRWFLEGLGRLVDDRFGGAVTIPMLTPLYTARRL